MYISSDLPPEFCQAGIVLADVASCRWPPPLYSPGSRAQGGKCTSPSPGSYHPPEIVRGGWEVVRGSRTAEFVFFPPCKLPGEKLSGVSVRPKLSPPEVPQGSVSYGSYKLPVAGEQASLCIPMTWLGPSPTQGTTGPPSRRSPCRQMVIRTHHRRRIHAVWPWKNKSPAFGACTQTRGKSLQKVFTNNGLLQRILNVSSKIVQIFPIYDPR